LNDSLKLYQALNTGVITLIESFFNQTASEAQKALDIYKLFTRETEGLIQIFDISKKFSRKELPEIQHAPTTLVEAFENYIDDLKKGKTPAPDAKKREISKAVSEPKKGADMKWDEFDFSPKEDLVKGMDEAKFNAQFGSNPFPDSNKSSSDPFSDDKDALPTSAPKDRSSTTSSPQRTASSDPFAPSPPQHVSTNNNNNNSNNNSNSNSNNNNNAAKDPFTDFFGGPSFSSPTQQQMQQPSYDEKKKNITNLFSQPVQNSGGFPAIQSTPLVAQQMQQPPQQTQYNFPSQPFFGQQQPPQQQQQFFQQQQPLQQQQPFFQQQQNTTNPFASQPMQTQQQQNTNPFAF